MSFCKLANIFLYNICGVVCQIFPSTMSKCVLAFGSSTTFFENMVFNKKGKNLCINEGFDGKFIYALCILKALKIKQKKLNQKKL
jgi:hypothetical protein